MAYTPRIVDRELRERLAGTGAVLIEGPRACGKTATARNVCASEVLFDVDENMRAAVDLDPAAVLAGDTPRLLDEWQLAPAIWNHIRRAVDDRRRPDQFVLTGSAMPMDDAVRHTGAGRITRLRMRPMSLFELNRSGGEVSLAALLAGEHPGPARAEKSVAEIAGEVAIGGWPALRSEKTDRALRTLRNYLDDISRLDLSRLDDRRRDPVRVGRLLASLARNVATHASATTLARDAGGEEGPLDDDTVREYLSALERLMVLENQPAWAPHLRSTYALRRSPRRHFVDPSLAVAALGASPERLREDLGFLGFLFESLVIRDLRIYAQAVDAQVLQYRDSSNLEVDAIVQGLDNQWAAFEVKLGFSQVEEAAANLIKFANRIDTERCGAPTALGVIIGSGQGFTRDDGVHVIPIGALGP